MLSVPFRIVRWDRPVQLLLIVCAAASLAGCSLLHKSPGAQEAARRAAYTAALSRSAAELMEDLHSRDEFVRLAAATRLGEIKGPDLVRPLSAAMADAVYDVRVAAARSLAGLRDPAATEPLWGALLNSDYAIRVAAARALVKMHDLEAIRPMLLVAPSTGEPMYAALLTYGEQAIPILISCLKDPDRRPSAAAVLARLGSPAIGPLTAQVAPQENKRARMAAAWALSQMEDERASIALDEAFRKQDFELLAAAYSRFIRPPRQGSEKVLVQALLSEGDLGMAEAYLGSGNPVLKRGAEEWFRKSGYVSMRSAEVRTNSPPEEPDLPPAQLAVFHFDGSFADSTGRGPSESKLASLVPGRWGSAATVAPGGALRYPVEGAWDFREGTVELWIALTRPGTDAVYTQYNHAALLYTAPDGNQFVVSENAERGFFAGSVIGGSFSGVGGGNISGWNPGEWHHLAFTYSARYGRERLYLDGNMVSESGGPLPLPASGTKSFQLNGDSKGHASAFAVDELRITANEKSPAAIQFDADRERPFLDTDVYRAVTPLMASRN